MNIEDVFYTIAGVVGFMLLLGGVALFLGNFAGFNELDKDE